MPLLGTRGVASARGFGLFGRIPGDPFFSSTTLLLPGNGTNGAQNNTFLDSSTNAFSITRNGNTTQGTFSPFPPASGTAYSAAANGGSGYFDGSGDYLTAANNPAFAFGTGDFTVEYWAYSQDVSTPAERGTLQTSDTVGGLKTTYTTGIMVAQGVGGNGKILANVAGTSISSATAPLVVNTWQHIAIVRNSGTVTIYVNGTSVASGTASGNCSGEYLAVGGYYSTAYLFNGYLSSLRIVKGTAVYTANFTPPTAPLTAITNTSLLLNFTNAGVLDATAKNDLETVGNAQISTAQSKWGGASIAFDGTGDYLPFRGNTAPASYTGFGTGNFTIEGWVYCTSAASANNGIFDARYSAAATGPLLYYIPGTGLFMFYNGSNRISGGTFTINTWVHVALVRSSAVTKLYINGTQTGGDYSDTNNYTSGVNAGFVGTFYDGTGNWNGYIDDFRVTNGIARYTANFTAPTAPFPLY